MADFDNLAEINENFDTIKTLLNSIRAQGILNTSDVDKLLSGINMKLEKINTEEDIDLIKIFLSELKQNLDERHNLLISKFGAIESLFANLLKNSSEMLKSSEVKELFDIVATNLSVFSREVVSQKESLTDISLRLDAIRSDDSQKKDIIKNITLLKSDIDRIGNGFDSIVISLNDNFKNVVKSITSLDKTEYFDKFSDVLLNIEMSSNTVLSALQMLDKKTEQVENALREVATKDDMAGAAQKIFELTAQSHELTAAVSDLNNKYVKFDTLNDKIDASVSVIAGLKSVLEDTDNVHTQKILSEISAIQEKLINISSEEKFEEIKVGLSEIFKYIQERSESLGNRSVLIFEEVQKLAALLQALDIQHGFENLGNEVKTSSSNVMVELDKKAQALTLLSETSVTRVVNEISDSADSLSAKLAQAQIAINNICESNFTSVFEKVADVKALIAQIDENSVSANNAIFSSITDRLSLFENSLRDSLELQEKTVLNSSAQLVEHIENIKNVSNVLDYKLDTSVVEAANVKREFAELKNSVENVLALDFTNVVKDLRIDLYAVKQDLSNSFDNSSSELTERFTSDLYGKYELLVSKIDAVEDELRKTQVASLASLKGVLDNISSSLVDVLSYVSEAKSSAYEIDNTKFDEIINLLNDSNINYVENVRDIVDVIRVQVESNIKSLEEETLSNFDNIKKVVSENSENIRAELKHTYSKLLEIQDSYLELQELLNISNETGNNKFTEVITATKGLKSDVELKLDSFKETLLDNISNFKTDFTCENADKISEIKFAVDSLYNKNSEEVQALVAEIRESISKLACDEVDGRTAALAKLSGEFSSLKDVLYNLQDKTSDILVDKTFNVLEDLKSLRILITELQDKSTELIVDKAGNLFSDFESLRDLLAQIQIKSSEQLTEKVLSLTSEINSVKQLMSEIQNKSTNYVDKKSTEIIADLGSIKAMLPELQSKSADLITKKSVDLTKELETIKNILPELQNKSGELITKTATELVDELGSVKALLPELQDKTEVLLKENIVSFTKNVEILKQYITTLQNDNSNNIESKLQDVLNNLQVAQEVINKLDENVDGDMSRQLSIIESNFESLVSQITILFEKADMSLSNNIESEFLKVSATMQNSIDQKLDNYKNIIEKVFAELKDKALEQSDYLQERISGLHTTLKAVWDEQSKDNAEQILALNKELKELLEGNNNISISALKDLRTQVESYSNHVEEKNEELTIRLNAQVDDIAKYVNTILDVQAQEDEERQTELNELLTAISTKIEGINSELVNSKSSIIEKITEIKDFATDSAKDQLLVIDAYVNNIVEQFELQKNNVISCKDLILKAFKAELAIISTNVEKETDIIVGEIIEQFDLMKKSQNDEFVSLASRIEEIVNAQVYNSIEDLKEYLDIKTDNSVLNAKFDNLKNDFSISINSVIDSVAKLLDNEVFVSSMSDFKLANEILINNAADSLNSRLEDFVNSNLTNIYSLIESGNKKLDDKFTLFDKKFVDLLIDKFEEIKLITVSYNDSFDKIQAMIANSVSEFDYVKQAINNEIESLSQLIKNSVTATNSAIGKLNEGFNELKQAVLNKSSDLKLQEAIAKQITEVEDLVAEQMNYLQNIEEVCAANLPDLSEISVLVKHSVLTSLNDLSERIGNINFSEQIDNEIKQLKSDIITQFLNIFNQISFVVEQEEIIDYIQEKHDELITILSHIVTTADTIEDVKDNVAVVDNKIDALREDIDLINEKITAIISADGDIDYVYSLQDLEADIANLRLVLNEMKNSGNNFGDLIESTEKVYKLVESFKGELPSKQEFETMAEDLVSISTRTNKLILASDESYKNLQDNLQDFKLVINDLDERTRNFARESGLDRIDVKLNALNNMVQNGAKTNQVFNQVFEYLAEWVDNASVQINTISDKVETLDDIGQIKSMLLDLKAGADDNTETIELIEALGAVFDKQTKRISALETKLDKIIVETTINNKNNKLDLTPFESTLNSFLVAIDEKMSAQQEKINSLESKIQTVVSAFDEKETSQLTKKVGGMDRQIAKLNKSIEKIASYVVEK